VVSYQRPVYFQKDEPIEFLSIPRSFSVIIADSGIPGNTRQAVEGVRDKWQGDKEGYGKVFDEIGEICRDAREQILRGNPDNLGSLMNRNQSLLEELGVSTPELENLLAAAREAGALGAKLSGGGLGGHIIALGIEKTEIICQHLRESGAAMVQIIQVEDRESSS
jgi:mevalonate kinase